MPDPIKLRNGKFTLDKRLDRCMEFDDRSRSYSIMEIVARKLRSYTWRIDETLDQGSEGACVGFGVTHELAARPSEVQNLTNAFAFDLYHAAQKIDPWEGEDYSGTSVLAGTKIAQQLGYFEEYRWAFGLEELIYGVGHNGPAVLGIPWYKDMYSPDSDGFISVSGKKVGGHCILCRAVKITKKSDDNGPLDFGDIEGYFTLRNSWGGDWGKGGDCYITFADMDKLLKLRGEAVFFMGRHTIPEDSDSD